MSGGQELEARTEPQFRSVVFGSVGWTVLGESEQLVAQVLKRRPVGI